ncbi:MAG: hypothetical protein KDC67_10440, partial [Ignavibacteriae bacterium]|nr:hypothetical protein [Ignavibacteriota bacterium]
LENKIKEFEQVVNILLPWYILRLKVVVGNIQNLREELISTKRKSEEILIHRWRENDSLQYEISSVFADILSLAKNNSKTQIHSIYKQFFNQDKKIWIEDHFKLLRNSSRLKHLKNISSLEETTIRNVIEASKDEEPETTANWYVEVARAILNLDKNDSAIYFSRALEAVSKFGDEIGQRWKAISALAEKAAQNKVYNNQLSYRYIRCAEQVGESVGREKYWDRNHAIKICSKLAPSIGLSSLSRWRDRNIGWFNEQIIYLARVLVEDNVISLSSGWALTPFFREYGIIDFACFCIAKSSSQKIKEYIIKSAIHQLQLNDAPYKDWLKLKEKTKSNSPEYRKILDIVEFYENNPGITNENDDNDYIIKKDNLRTPNWKIIFQGIDLTIGEGILEALERFNKLPDIYAYRNSFWIELNSRIPEYDIIKYLKTLVLTADIDDYEVKYALTNLPERWKKKISFQHNLPQIYKLIAARFFLNYSVEEFGKQFFHDIEKRKDYSSDILEGIIEGFINNSENLQANSYFRFVEIVKDIISHEEAIKLLDFALERFEIHINKEFADGQWSKWLTPPNNIIDAYTGLIWSALGSPVAKVRWQAVHSVRKLCEMNCSKEVSALVKWMDKETQDAFGNIKFPFYNLHSRLYLLIAFSRVSIDLPEILLPHANVFMKIALNDIPHVLIQKFASEVVLNIESKFPKTFSDNVLHKLKDVNVSQLPIKNSKDVANRQYNPFDSGESFGKRKFYIEMDFPKYWFNSLSRIFDISINKIIELVEKVITSDWKIKDDGSYKRDPRHHLWRYERD